jgi:hypothetical protein
MDVAPKDNKKGDQNLEYELEKGMKGPDVIYDSHDEYQGRSHEKSLHSREEYAVENEGCAKSQIHGDPTHKRSGLAMDLAPIGLIEDAQFQSQEATERGDEKG